MCSIFVSEIALMQLQLAPKYVRGSDHNPSPKSMYQDLLSGDIYSCREPGHATCLLEGYTVLVPTFSDIQGMKADVEMGFISETQALFTLLLHIIPGRHYKADLLSSAHECTLLSFWAWCSP
jgi:hypothetical protein